MMIDLKTARKAIVFVIGGTVLLTGLALLILPGPAFIVIPLGLFILASEFVWARNLLEKVRKRIPETNGKISRKITEFFRKN